MSYGTRDAVVVIPTYRNRLSPSERASLSRCVEVLGKHPITFIAPAGLELAPEVRAVAGARVRRFHPAYFKSVDGYNRLLLNPRLYQGFSEYEYILIHQLDVFVFHDHLSEWCRRGFHYVGSPWPAGSPVVTSVGPQCSLVGRMKSRLGIGVPGRVGNGGFSLRHVRTALWSLRLLAFGRRGWVGNEDLFWSFYVPSYLPWFRIPSADVAVHFGFEQEPEECFKRAGGRLPFGCHRWMTYGTEFWRPHLCSMEE